MARNEIGSGKACTKEKQMTVTIAQMQAWNRVQQMAAQKKAQAERQAKIMAVMKPSNTLTERKA